jgi:hypothetical protein
MTVAIDMESFIDYGSVVTPNKTNPISEIIIIEYNQAEILIGSAVESSVNGFYNIFTVLILLIYSILLYRVQPAL